MALSYDSLSALIQTKYMKVLADNIFVKSHPLTAILKGKAKSFNTREIGVPIEYAEAGASNVTWGGPGQTYTPATTDPFTMAVYEPKMLTGTLKVNKEEFLVMDSEEAVKNIVTSKVKNLQKTLEKSFADALWTTTANACNSLPALLASSGTVGGSAVADFADWVTDVLDAEDFATGSGTGGILTEADLYDADAPFYLPKMIARGVANAKEQTGENPDVIVMTQYLWDVLESILDPRKTGNKFHERMGSIGFTALDFRGIAIVADNDLPDTGDKASIYFINSDYLYMFFNSGAKFTAGKFIESDVGNTHTMKVHTYGNLVTSNRGAHCVISNVYSDSSYV